MRADPTIATITTSMRRFLWSVMLVGILTPAAYADDRQYKIESAYLYSFFNYITWPGFSSPQAMDTPVICVEENDPAITYLEYIRNKMKAERLLTVRPLSGEQSSVGCHILFIRHRMPKQLSARAETLVILKPDDPLDRGGMIELAEDGDRISIRIDQQQLDKNGFQVSSRLLDLVQRVK